MAAWTELHVQRGRTRLELMNDLERGYINDLDGVVQGMGKIHPGMAAVGTRHGEYRLAMYGNASSFLKRARVESE